MEGSINIYLVISHYRNEGHDHMVKECGKLCLKVLAYKVQWLTTEGENNWIFVPFMKRAGLGGCRL